MSKSKSTIFKNIEKKLGVSTAEILSQLQNGVELTDHNGSTALLIAAMQNNTKAVTILLNNGANPNTKNSSGVSALSYMKTTVLDDETKELLDFTQDITNNLEQYDEESLNELFFNACKLGLTSFTPQILKAKAVLEKHSDNEYHGVYNENGDNFLQDLVKNSKPQILENFLHQASKDKSASKIIKHMMEERDEYGYTMLQTLLTGGYKALTPDDGAAYRKEMKYCQQKAHSLIRHGADVTTLTSAGLSIVELVQIHGISPELYDLLDHIIASNDLLYSIAEKKCHALDSLSNTESPLDLMQYEATHDAIEGMWTEMQSIIIGEAGHAVDADA